MKITSKNYEGKLYIKIGRKHIPLEQDIVYFEKLEQENEQLKQQIEKMKCCTNCKHNECKCEDVVCKKENECWYDKAEEEHLFLELEKVKLECWELAK